MGVRSLNAFEDLGLCPQPLTFSGPSPAPFDITGMFSIDFSVSKTAQDTLTFSLDAGELSHMCDREAMGEGSCRARFCASCIGVNPE